MSAIHTLLEQLRATLPAAEAESIIASYRENAAADSRASRKRTKERHQRQRESRQQRQTTTDKEATS